MSGNKDTSHTHVSWEECMLYLNNSLIVQTVEQFKILKPIIQKITDCATCRAIFRECKELRSLVNSEFELTPVSSEVLEKFSGSNDLNMVSIIDKIIEEFKAIGYSIADTFETVFTPLARPEAAHRHLMIATRSKKSDVSAIDVGIVFEMISPGHYTFDLGSATTFCLEIPFELADAVDKAAIVSFDDTEITEDRIYDMDLSENDRFITSEITLQAGKYNLYFISQSKEEN